MAVRKLQLYRREQGLNLPRGAAAKALGLLGPVAPATGPTPDDDEPPF